MKSAFMLAATGSGSGKTTITCALLKAMKNRKLNCSSFKCGPDYIDPMFHKNVLKIESQNLDLFFSDREEVRKLFYMNNTSDVSLVEGVMGLYDGVNPLSNEGSSYDLACKLNIPVVLVINARGMGRSLLAVIKGFKAMDSEDRIAGVILNQITESFYNTIKPIIEAEEKVKVLGFFPKLTEGSIESRYLGLKLPEEIEKLNDNIENAAQIIEKSLDLDLLLSISKVDADGVSFADDNVNSCDVKARIAVARDRAFCFYYQPNLDLLKKCGAELVEFSPLEDTSLPENIDGILLGGGYPELHARMLCDNVSLREEILAAINKGMPSLAECGGFMYLHKAIIVDGKAYEMVGAVDGVCEKKDKLVRFGYLTIEDKAGNFIKGSVKGHEFHYYDSSNNGNDGISRKPYGDRNWESGHIGEKNWWGFAHLYYASNKEFVTGFVGKCAKWRAENGKLL